MGGTLTELNLKFYKRMPYEVIDEWFEDFIPPIGAFVEINGHRYKIHNIVIEQKRSKDKPRVVHIEIL